MCIICYCIFSLKWKLSPLSDGYGNFSLVLAHRKIPGIDGSRIHYIKSKSKYCLRVRQFSTENIILTCPLAVHYWLLNKPVRQLLFLEFVYVLIHSNCSIWMVYRAGYITFVQCFRYSVIPFKLNVLLTKNIFFISHSIRLVIVQAKVSNRSSQHSMVDFPGKTSNKIAVWDQKL